MDKNIVEKLKGKRILFATVAADGHINPLTGLASTLATVGCDVRWYTAHTYEQKIERLGIPFYPFIQAPLVTGTNVGDVFPEREGITDLLAKADFDMHYIFADMAPGALRDIQQIEQEFSFDILIADCLFSAIPLVKGVMNKPVISIGVVPLAEESADIAINGLPMNSLSEEERKEFLHLKEVINNAFRKSTDAFSTILSAYGVTHKKSPLYDLLIKSADLYLQIGTPSFEYKRNDMGTNIRFIGALLPYMGTKKETWFDERIKRYQKIVLVTQGTVETDTSKLLEPTLEAFRDSDILVIATTGGHDTERLRFEFSANNYIIEDFIAYEDVMPFASVYVTNGGYGGTLLAIHHGLPMVAAGIHEGKGQVCVRIGHFKYGIDLQTETPSSALVREAVNQVMHAPIYKENVLQLSKEFDRYRPEELCAEYIVSLLENTVQVPLT